MNVSTLLPSPAWLDDYDFELPDTQIAREPMEPRDASRLLVYERAHDRVTFTQFRDLPEWLEAGDVVVLNETQVLRARLRARLARTGRDVEILLSHPEEEPEGDWWAMLGPSRRLRGGDLLELTEAGGAFEIVERDADGLWCLRPRGAQVDTMMREGGHVPLPPYLRREDRVADRQRYQTVFARQPGAVAAPTAGLHFTRDLLDRLEARGIVVARITLHVGPGTFLPVRATTAETHRVLEERFEVPAATVAALRRAREAGRRIVPVGTTVVRCLETVAPEALAATHSSTSEFLGWTGLTITPGFTFQATDALVTNFHLPKSSLLLLVAALTGRDALLRVYGIAVDAGFRFYSYGDAMLIV